MAEEYIGICAACTKGVTRDTMKYVNGRVFHPECYQKHGKDFLAVDQELAAKTAKLKIDLIQLKNLKSRRSNPKKPSTSKPKRKTNQKSTKRRAAKTKRSKPKSGTKRRAAKTKRSKPKSGTKRRAAKKRRR